MDVSDSYPRMGTLLALLAALTVFALPATAGAAQVETKKATGKVERWTSPQVFDAPIAVVSIRHNGRLLDSTAVSSCRQTYVDEDITVQVGTCGARWRVRTAYVSLSGRSERFQIIYAPRG